MTISSRTPEGDPNQCPICGHHVRIEPSLGTRDAPCPSCGHLLWFAERTPYARDHRVTIDLDKVLQESKELIADAQTSALVTLVKIVSKRCGPPHGEIKLELNRMPLSKFTKFDWDQLLSVSSWDEVIRLLEATPE